MNNWRQIFSVKNNVLDDDVSDIIYLHHKYNVYDPIVPIIVTKPFEIFNDHGDKFEAAIGDRLWITGLWPDVYEMQQEGGGRVWGRYQEVDANTDFMSNSVKSNWRELLITKSWQTISGDK